MYTQVHTNSSEVKTFIVSIFFRRENSGTERFDNLPKHTQPGIKWENLDSNQVASFKDNPLRAPVAQSVSTRYLYKDNPLNYSLTGPLSPHLPHGGKYLLTDVSAPQKSDSSCI